MLDAEQERIVGQTGGPGEEDLEKDTRTDQSRWRVQKVTKPGATHVDMPPFCEQNGRGSSCPEQAEDAAEDVALPETDTPSSSPSSPRTLSPPPEELPAVNYQYFQRYYFDMNPLPLMQEGVPDFLPIDHNLPQLLRRVTGTDDLLSVRELKLRVISREMSLQRLCLYMPALRELNLTGSCLGSLRDLGCELRNLHVLRINRCGLDSLDGTFGLTSVRELYAAHNRIEDVSPCTSLPHIRVLDLRNNLVQDTGYVSFLSFCDNLESLVLAECPVARNEGYRADIQRLLPHLITLDDVPVDRGQDGEDDLGFNEDFDDNDGNENNDIGGQGDTDGMGGSKQDPKSLERHVDEMNKRNRQESGPSDSDKNDLPRCPPMKVKLQPITQVKQRPFTAATCQVKSKNEERKPLMKQRPSTACTPRTSTDVQDSHSSGPPDFRGDSPSILTSGEVVYGNLAAVLRRKKKHVKAWDDKPEQSNRAHLDEMQKKLKEEMISISNKMANLSAKGDSVENIKDQLGIQRPSSPTNGDSTSEDSEDLLDKSRRWRTLYHAYRSENRARWEKERIEESISETPTDDKKLESHRRIIKKIHEKSISTNTAPCCSAVFGPKMKNSGTSDPNSYNNRTNSEKSENENEKKKKKGGRFPARLY
ncbi:uncharacterized protein [Anabrus simplex]|uniref:uncharacterized protein n=1 Tax=Anabrus simplex TaxID=316456 RepID=UPI0035A2EE23